MKRQVLFLAAALSSSLLLGGCGAADQAYDRGMEAAASGDYQKAEEYLKKALKKNQERAEYYIGYGVILNEQGRYEEALEQFEQAHQDTKNSIANANNKQIYYGEAVSYYHLGDYEKGLELCGEALEFSEPSSIDSRIYCSRGALQEALGDQEAALESYQKVIELDAENWQAYYRMSAIYQAQGDEDAVSQTQSFLETAVQDGVTEALYYLGMIALEQGNTKQAKKYLKEYVSQNEGDYLVAAYNELAGCAIQEEDLELAREYLEAGMSEAGSEEAKQLWRNQIILLERQGEFGQARQVAEEYLQEYPEDQEIERELRFLRTRNKKAKGMQPVTATAEPESEATGTPVPETGNESENSIDDLTESQ